jgi:hypothetical protein
MATRILLRSRQNGLFVSGALTWSPTSQQAHEFPSAHAADDFARENGLKRMEIVVLREKGLLLRISLDGRREK